MGQLHDTITDSIALYLIKNSIFGNRYLATNVPLYPRPDFILLSRSKHPDHDIAFEVKPPHADKREYVTGLGQSISYLQYYPISYLIIPNEIIDGFSIPNLMSDNIKTIQSNSIGLISYDIKEYEPTIEAHATGKTHSDRRPVEAIEVGLGLLLPLIEKYNINAKLCH